MAIPRLKPTLDFLLALQGHNNKPWFQAHRAEYETARASFEDFVDNFIQEFRSIEDFENLSAKDCVFRIYRDVRFSKDCMQSESPCHFDADNTGQLRRSPRSSF